MLENSSYGLAAITPPADAYAGKQFGHYRIIREIGRGGMGAVFLAERTDGEFDQKVALKIVRRSFADPEIARRFRQERQILASLNHPNIAKLLDGGVSSDGEPFLAMEYVEGVWIDEFCKRENLPLTKILNLFLRVCAAVSFAHQNLIVHRDIKPSNIIVTPDGTPKLLDFGIAKLLDRNQPDERTATDYRAFTPAYASPEQASGARVTTASDVYNLGVLLANLVENSALSFVPRSSQKNAASPDQAQKTKTVKLKTKNELSAILAMARRAEPERRYAAVQQFAEDIERYLNGKTVRARQDSFGYRAEKFVQRNRATVTAAALVALSLVAGSAVSLWQANAARLERDRAEKRFADVRQLSNALLNDIAPKIERLPGALEARGAVVGQSLKYLDSLASESSGDSDLQIELAAAYEKIGDLQGNPTNPNFVEFDEALKSYLKANEIRRNIAAKNPGDAAARQRFAENHRILGNIYSQTNEIENSTANTGAAQRIYQSLVDEQPASAELRLALARAFYDSGLNLQTSKKYDYAVPYFEKAEELLTSLNAETPVRTKVLRSLGETKAQHASALSWAEQQPQAETAIRQAIEIYERLFENNRDDVAVRSGIWLVYWLASNIYQDQNDKLAFDYASRATDVARETVEKDQTNPRAKQQLAKSYSTLGERATTIGKSGEALESLEKACRLQREIIESTTKNQRLKSELALSLMRFGAAQAEQKLFSKALENLRQSENIYQEILTATPNDRRSNRNLANTYEQIARTNEKLFAVEKSHVFAGAAQAAYQKAFAVLQRLADNNQLADADRKFLEEMRRAAQKYEQSPK